MSTAHGERPYTYHPNLSNAGAFRDNYDTAFGKPHWKCSAGVRNGMDDAKCWHCGEEKPDVEFTNLERTAAYRIVAKREDVRPYGYEVAGLIHAYMQPRPDGFFVEHYYKPENIPLT